MTYAQRFHPTEKSTTDCMYLPPWNHHVCIDAHKVAKTIQLNWRIEKVTTSSIFLSDSGSTFVCNCECLLLALIDLTCRNHLTSIWKVKFSCSVGMSGALFRASIWFVTARSCYVTVLLRCCLVTSQPCYVTVLLRHDLVTSLSCYGTVTVP